MIVYYSLLTLLYTKKMFFHVVVITKEMRSSLYINYTKSSLFIYDVKAENFKLFLDKVYR